MEFRGFWISMLGVVLIVIAMTGFITTTQSHYTISQPLVNNSQVSYIHNLQNNLTVLYGKSNSSQSSFYATSPSTDAGGLFTTGIASAGQLLSGGLQLIYDILIGGVASTLGIDVSVTLLLETMIVGGLILLIWSLWRLGR